MTPATGRTPRVELPSRIEHRWQQLRLLEAWVSDQLEHALTRQHDLTLSEYCTLAALAYSDDSGHLRQQVLADMIPLNQSSLSRLVGRLERDGLTERYLCAEDRRGVYTQITAAGRTKLAQARPTYLRTLQEALDTVTAEDSYLTGLLADLS